MTIFLLMGKGKEQINSPRQNRNYIPNIEKRLDGEIYETRISKRTLLINDETPFHVTKTYKPHSNTPRPYFSGWSASRNENISSIQCIGMCAQEKINSYNPNNEMNRKRLFLLKAHVYLFLGRDTNCDVPFCLNLPLKTEVVRMIYALTVSSS